MFGGATDTAFTNRDAGACGQHDIDQGDLLEFGEDLARFVAKAGKLAPQAEGFSRSHRPESGRGCELVGGVASGARRAS